jgi:uncharacterized protein (DUF2236 family)
MIGAAVRDSSDFTRDPWGRLDRTLRSLQVQLFGGPAAVAEAERLRALHRSIRGSGFSGERYSALDPDAYAWVHLSNFDSVLAFHRWFGPPLVRTQQAQLYDEWRRVGLVLGVRADRMPRDLDSLRTYVRNVVAHTLVDNGTARALLAGLRLEGVSVPPWRFFPDPLWWVLRPLGGSFVHDVTVGTLPARLRETLGLRWTMADRRRLRAAAVLVRAASAPLPDRVLHYPLAARARREARRVRRDAA